MFTREDTSTGPKTQRATDLGMKAVRAGGRTTCTSHHIQRSRAGVSMLHPYARQRTHTKQYE